MLNVHHPNAAVKNFAEKDCRGIQISMEKHGVTVQPDKDGDGMGKRRKIIKSRKRGREK